MANTRSSAKRARQSQKKQLRNKMVRSATKTFVKAAVEALTTVDQDVAVVQKAYLQAVKALSKAASKGVIPARRASRKISKLTKFGKKSAPAAFGA